MFEIRTIGTPSEQYSLLLKAKPPRSGAMSPDLRCSQEKFSPFNQDRVIRKFEILYLCMTYSINVEIYQPCGI